MQCRFPSLLEWAQGTIATTCSSFIWLAAQHANVKLEGPNKVTTVDDLEPRDIVPNNNQLHRQQRSSEPLTHSRPAAA
jgi:hypothetical protein